VKAFWRTENPRTAVVRDIAVAGGVVLLLLFAVWGYTGQSFPTEAPLVVVESGSMMHGPYRSGIQSNPTGWSDPVFGRIGTIDPGDLVFVKDVDEASDIEVAFGGGRRDGYGAHGDVIIFKPFGTEGTPIIHRAMLYVEAQPEGCSPGTDCVYRVPAACDDGFADHVVSLDSPSSVAALCSGTSSSISMVLERGGVGLRMTDYPCNGDCGPFYSSFLTRGDNNDANDQNAHQPGRACFQPGSGCNSSPVRLDWILGKARSEVPWFGLIKLALYGNPNYQIHTDPTHSTHWNIFRAKAPWDLWMSLFLTLGVVVATPVAIDIVRARLQKDDGDAGPPKGNEGPRTPPAGRGGPPPGS
jgi:signal peptidase